MARKTPALADRIAGKLKRAIGELAARPDLVIEGEAQDTGCEPEDKPPAPPTSSRERQAPGE